MEFSFPDGLNTSDPKPNLDFPDGLNTSDPKPNLDQRNAIEVSICRQGSWKRPSKRLGVDYSSMVWAVWVKKSARLCGGAYSLSLSGYEFSICSVVKFPLPLSSRTSRMLKNLYPATGIRTYKERLSDIKFWEEPHVFGTGLGGATRVAIVRCACEASREALAPQKILVDPVGCMVGLSENGMYPPNIAIFMRKMIVKHQFWEQLPYFQTNPYHVAFP